VVVGRFCWGFWGIRVDGDGFLLVRLWWMRGELWCFDGGFFGAIFFLFFEIYLLLLSNRRFPSGRQRQLWAGA
jgi:hypothetical protein